VCIDEDWRRTEIRSKEVGIQPWSQGRLAGQRSDRQSTTDRDERECQSQTSTSDSPKRSRTNQIRKRKKLSVPVQSVGKKMESRESKDKPRGEGRVVIWDLSKKKQERRSGSRGGDSEETVREGGGKKVLWAQGQ